MDEQAQTVKISKRAAQRIKEILAKESKKFMLRVAVSGGGCSGFQYTFALDDHTTPDDLVVAHHGAKVVVDAASLMFMEGAEIDYEDALIGAAFRIHNPNATASCGCGTSFSV